MPFSWGDTIDSSTDIFDVSLWNTVAAAVHERNLAARSILIQFEDPPTEPATPIVKAAGDTLLKGVTTLDSYTSIADMQNSLGIDQYVRHDLYPTGLQGLAAVPSDFTWTGYSMGEALGYPEPPTTSWVRLWRRKQPRRIFKINATNSQWFNTFLLSGTFYWALQQGAACEVGDKALFYDHWAISSGTPWSNLAHTKIPGTYYGVYVYQGGGVWTPAPSGSSPDILDSNEVWNTHNWCLPGTFGVGDIYGWWLFRDLVEACKLLKWTTSAAALRRPDGTLGYQSTGSIAVGPEATSAAAIAAAQAAIAGATYFDATVAVHGTPFFIAQVNGSGSSWYAYAYSAKLKFDAAEYQGLPRDIDFYGRASNYSGNPALTIFDDAGLGFTDGTYNKVETLALGAGGHSYAFDLSSQFGDGTTLPTFGDAQWRGMIVGNNARQVTRWGFTHS